MSIFPKPIFYIKNNFFQAPVVGMPATVFTDWTFDSLTTLDITLADSLVNVTLEGSTQFESV